MDIQPAILSETEQGAIEYLAGYVAHRLRTSDPNLQSGEQRGTMAPMSWVKHLSRGGLSVQSDDWRVECKRLESHFIQHNGTGIKRNMCLTSLLETHTSSYPKKRPHCIYELDSLLG